MPSLAARLRGLFSSPPFCFYLGGSVLYWLLRILYFSTTREQIFSDIRDYCSVADHILMRGDFALDGSLFYIPPGAPAAIALSKLLAGSGFAAFHPYLIALGAFAGVCLVTSELVHLTGRSYLGIAYFYLMALLKPSIFWQLKLSTEGLSEALIQLALGLALLACRRRSAALSGLCGVAVAWLFLTRPQYLLSVPFLMIFFGAMRGPRRVYLAAFSAGIALLWAPWIARNYLLSHRLIPVSSSGVVAGLFEYNLAPIRPGSYQRLTLADGTSVPLEMSAFAGQQRAQQGDSRYYDYTVELNRRWLALNFPYLWAPLVNRITNVLNSNDPMGLTTVSRDNLFRWPLAYVVPYAQQSPLNLLLVDKSAFLVLCGLAGMLQFARHYRVRSLPWLGLVAVIWLVPGFTIGYPRVVDPLAGPTLFGGFYLLTAWAGTPARDAGAAQMAGSVAAGRGRDESQSNE